VWLATRWRAITTAATAATAATRAANAGAKLPASEISTFAGGQAQRVVLRGGDILYGVRDVGSRTVWWTRNMPQSVAQWRDALAVRPEWNRATHIETLVVPKGQSLIGFEGNAAAQGVLRGGGNQVYVPNVPSEWLSRVPWNP
jgi:hypothetical protein